MRVIMMLVAAMLALTNPAQAQAQVRGNPEEIARLMAESGFGSRVTHDEGGDPMLESSIDDVRFNIYFFECKSDCMSIQFSAGFDLDTPLPMEMVNVWNRDRRFGRVYLDKMGDPFIEMDIGLADDGIGRKNFDDALETWRILLSEFRNFIDW